MRALLVLLLMFAAAAAAAAPARAAGIGLAYTHGDDIVITAADGSERRALHPSDGMDAVPADPAWSPDGATVALTSHSMILSRFSSSVVGVRRLGSPEWTEVPGALRAAYPAWTPDGGEIVVMTFPVDPDEVGSALVAIDVADGDRRTLTRTEHQNADPDVSPDGGRVAFTREGSVWVVPLAGGEAVRLTEGADPSWSPDGRRLAIVLGHDIAIHDLATRTTQRLPGPGTDREPAWSPDGRRILFSSDRDFPAAGSFEIHAMDPDGGCVTQLSWSRVRATAPDPRPGVAAHRGKCGGRTVTYRAPRIGGRWLHAGRRFGDLLLSTYGKHVGYRDCARPGRCREPLELVHHSACGDSVQVPRRGWRRVGTALLARRGEAWLLRTGRRVVEIRGAGGHPRRVVRRLGRLSPPRAC